MFKPEHLEALRHQIRSLQAAQLPKDHPFAGEFNPTIGDQAKLLEEIRIEIHNQLREYHPARLELTPEQLRKFRLQDGIIA